MKKLKLNKIPVIVVLVLCAIFLIVGIVFALLPIELWIDWGIYNLNARNYPLIACGIVDALMLLFTFTVAIVKLNYIKRINQMMLNMGEDSFAWECKIVDRKAARENAAANAVSAFFGILTASIFGIGFFRTSNNYNKRLFILYSEGMHMFNMMNNSESLLKKNDVWNLKITEKRSKLFIEFTPLNFTIRVKTRGLEITKEELIAKFKKVFTNPMADLFPDMQPKTTD